MSAEAARDSYADWAVMARATTAEELLLFWEEKDLYVQSATRNRKPISQVAENMTVITARDIEDMNAHTVSEVMARVPGVFVSFAGEDFGGTAIPFIQGSKDRHVLVLLDGIIWNFVNDGHAETISIPVYIIERIEIIKGPASSAWGSSLGGVINIITKNTGASHPPSGSVAASYGKRDSHEEYGELTGKAGPAGYYLFAGRQHSDGLSGPRSFDNSAFNAKFSAQPASNVNAALSFGASKPEYHNDSVASFDIASTIMLFRAHYASASLDASPAPDLKLHAYLHAINKEFQRTDSVLSGSGGFGPAGELFYNPQDKEKNTGEGIKLVWTRGRHTAVMGADAIRTKYAATNAAGPFLQSLGVPAVIAVDTEIEKWAAYVNDTMSVDKFSFTPGVRFDRNSVTGAFTSPSLGATYSPVERTIFRASAARGFTIPPIAFTSAGGIFYDPNPSLKPEEVRSYQAGLETGAWERLWLKAVVFRHDVRNDIERELGAGVGGGLNDLFVNRGRVMRQGYEVEAETAPLYNVSLKAGYSLVSIDPSEGETKVNARAVAELKYDDRKTLLAGLAGHYVWWDRIFAPTGKFNTFIWDLNLRKTVRQNERRHTDVFATVHNLFNGDQYDQSDRKNPKRWAEAGVRLKF